jgi:CBS domain containing-hemolysin-like protein
MLSLTVGLIPPILILYLGSVMVCQALRTYSRSRLEEYCERRGRPARFEEIMRHGERTERGAEALSFLTGLALAALLGASTQWFQSPLGIEVMLVCAVLIGGMGHIASVIVGRVYAEGVLERLWPVAKLLRIVMTPFTAIARSIEAVVYRRARRSFHAPRPVSVEVEIHSSHEDEEEDIEAELSESTREILERVVDLSRRDVTEIMIPASSMVTISASATLREAADIFVQSGRSRIPLYGENRDDIVGVLYAKDLFPRLIDSEAVRETLRSIVRPPFFVPESKNAAELLEQFQAERVQLAIAIDEYGAVAGLVTLEDLIEEIVGPIEDEHDVPTADEPIVNIGEGQYDVQATVEIETLNEALKLHLPTDESETIGGFAFNMLGRLPEPNESFHHNGVEFTVLDVSDRSIRRLRLSLQPQEAGVPRAQPRHS